MMPGKPDKQEKMKRLPPMLARLTDKPFNRENWLFEIKYDGYRAMALCDGRGNVDLYSRNFLSFNKKYPPIVAALSAISHPCLLDGEIVVEDKEGRSSFQLLQNYGQKAPMLKYYVFDLLNLDGNDVTRLPLRERKQLLKMLLQTSKLKNIFYSDHIETTGIKFYKEAVKRALEGIIAKDATSSYEPGKRTGEWLKIKIRNEQEAIIAGITGPKGSRHYFGSLLLGAYKEGKLKYIGKCGTGFDDKTLHELYEKFKPFFTDQSPFKEGLTMKAGITWLKPKFVCEIKFAEWTSDDNMRQAVFMGLRTDKKPAEVVIEKTR